MLVRDGGPQGARAGWLFVAETCGWALVFAAAMLVGRLTRVEGSELALAWPAAGVSVAWFLRAQGAVRRSVAVATLIVVTAVVNQLTGVEAVGAWLFGPVNAVHGLVAVAVLTGFGGWRSARPVRSLRDMTVLLGASVASAVVSAVSGGLVAWARFGTGILDGVGLIGARNAISTFVVTGALLALADLRAPRSLPRMTGTVATVTILLSLVLVRLPWPVSYALIPPMILVAVRCGPSVAAVVAFVQGILVVTATRVGQGPFANAGSVEVRVIEAQGLILVLALVGAIVALALQERSEGLAASRRDRDRLRDHMDAALVADAHVHVGSAGEMHAVDANAALTVLTGRERDELVGSDPSTWLVPSSVPLFIDGVETLTSGGRGGWRAELQLNDDFGDAWVDVALSVVRPGAAVSALELNFQMIDITAQKLAEERLAQLALHDDLTGLPNRALWSDRLETALAAAARDQSLVGLLYVDIDHFKSINDNYGHAVGDEVLQAIARRLSSLVRLEDTVARIGGDEFVVLCPTLSAPADGTRLAARIQQAMLPPVQAGGRMLSPTVSVGVASAVGGDDPRIVLRRADTALYSAKAAGRARFEVYRPDLHAALERSAQVLDELELAQRNRDLRVHYQIIVDRRTRRPVALEALLRWQLPDGGIRLPDAFMEVLESSELIHEVGADVLRQACAGGAALLRQGHRLRMHVNVSAKELARPGLLASVTEALEVSGLPPEFLVLEITETRLVAVNGSLLRDLTALRELGVLVAVDDFGTGYSALTHLVELPVDILKLDRTFVAEVVGSPSARAVCSGVAAMASGINIEAIAEGVESEEQALVLDDLGYGQLQGYLFSTPAPMAEVVRELETGSLAPLPAADSGRPR